MTLRAVEHIFNGTTTPLAFSNGTVAVSGTAVTGTNSFFTPSMVGMKIGFGSSSIGSITTWYTISAYVSYTSITLGSSAGSISAGTSYVITGYDSTKTSLGPSMVQKSGSNPEDNFVGPMPVAVVRPMEESTPVPVMYPHVITYNSTIDWVFCVENNAALAKRVFLYEYNKVLGTYNWKGFITANCGANATNVCRGFRAFRYLHTTGTVSVAAPVSFYSAGTSVALAISGIVTGVGTTFTIGMVGKMIGFGSTDVTKINCWYPIIAFASTTSITVSGASNVIAASANYVIADCIVTGSGTKFVDEGIAAGTNVIGAAGGLGPRIGFGSNDPTQITQWFQIGSINGETSINLVTSPGVIAAGTPYVIEELRFAFALTNTTAINGGLFLAKGIGYYDFETSSTAGPLVLPFIASNVDNQRGVYWLSDAGTAANVVTNVASCGLTIQPEINKGLHYAYIPDGVGSAYMKVYRYNLRATGTVTAGKMTMSVAYTTSGTVTVSSGVVTASGTPFNASMVGMKIGFGSSSPALITTWYTIGTYTSTSSVTLTNLTVGVGAGSSYIVDSADVLCTGNELVAGGVVAVNNGRIGTLNHGPGAGVESLYFVTATRIYRAALSNIYANNLDWISDNRPEIPPGSSTSFGLTNGLNAVEIADQIDRLIILTTGSATRNYVTRYPNTAGDQFDHFWGVDDKQMDQSTADPNTPIHFNTISQVLSIWSQNGIAHILKHGAGAALCQMHALPLSAHYLYSDITGQSVMTPAISTPDCSSYKRLLISNVGYLGNNTFMLPTESIFSYYRTSGITDNSGKWFLIKRDGDLSGISSATTIQFMFRFSTIASLCIAGRIMSATVLYNDYSTDSHYQVSVGKSDLTTKKIAWRFSTAFGSTVPVLRVKLYDAVTGGLILDDKTTGSVGTWEKTIDGGSNWTIYDTADKTNEVTYIRYTPATLPDNTKIRPLLTLY